MHLWKEMFSLKYSLHKINFNLFSWSNSPSLLFYFGLFSPCHTTPQNDWKAAKKENFQNQYNGVQFTFFYSWGPKPLRNIKFNKYIWRFDVFWTHFPPPKERSFFEEFLTTSMMHWFLLFRAIFMVENVQSFCWQFFMYKIIT